MPWNRGALPVINFVLRRLALKQRVNGLDQYFDEVEVLLDELATQYGLETSTSI